MTGASFLNLQMFQAFCGEKYSPQVVFVTAMWNTIGDNNAAQQQLISREKELAATPKFWGDMITHGARVRQFHGDRASGLDIIHLLYQQEHGRKPRIMSEFDHGYILPDTGAGQVITAEIMRQQKRREKEEREEREEIEAEQSSRRRALSLNNSPRRPQTAPRPHIQRRPPPPPPPPARGPQREGPHRHQPNPAARQAAQFVYYSRWSVGPP